MASRAEFFVQCAGGGQRGQSYQEEDDGVVGKERESVDDSFKAIEGGDQAEGGQQREEQRKALEDRARLAAQSLGESSFADQERAGALRHVSTIAQVLALPARFRHTLVYAP